MTIPQQRLHRRPGGVAYFLGRPASVWRRALQPTRQPDRRAR